MHVFGLWEGGRVPEQNREPTYCEPLQHHEVYQVCISYLGHSKGDTDTLWEQSFPNIPGFTKKQKKQPQFLT